MKFIKRLFRRKLKERYTFSCVRSFCGFGYESNVEEMTRAVANEHNKTYHKNSFKSWPS